MSVALSQGSDRTVEAILGAAVEQFVLTGVRRTSADDVARRAGVNRATLYRRVGTKHQIVAAAFLQETGRALARIEAAIGAVPPPGTDGFDATAYVRRFFSVTLTEVRENPLLQQLMRTDRDETLSGLTAGAGDFIALSSGLVARRIHQLRPHVGNTRTDDIEAVANTMARITQSLLLTPDGLPMLGTARQRRTFADRVVVPLVLGV